MKKYKDITGQKFNMLTAVKYYGKDYKRNSLWEFNCDCGNIKVVSVTSVTLGKTKSCGCIIRPGRTPENLSGMVFGFLTVIDRIGNKCKCICCCGVERYVLPGNLKSGTTKSCGICNRQYGEKHHHWNPLLTNKERINKRKKNRIELYNWRKAVFIRDNYTCQICKKIGGTLNAHHMNSWHWCIKERLDLDNGVTLCGGKGSCHNKFHSIYGRKNNTKEQFIEFKNNA